MKPPLIIHGSANRLYIAGRFLCLDNTERHESTSFAPHQFPYECVLLDSRAHGNMTMAATRWLLINEIPVHFIDYTGNLTGSFLPAGPSGGKTKLGQYSAYFDREKRHTIATEFIREKLTTSLEALRFLQRYYPAVSPEDFITNSKLDTHAPNLTLLEGRAARYYWAEFSKVVNQLAPDWKFDGRASIAQHNVGSIDKTNACLNYLYAVLQGHVRVALHAAGLDPSIGYLHEPAGPSGVSSPLVYDTMEPWRFSADLTLIRLLESGVLQDAKFVHTPDLRVEVGPVVGKLLVEQLTETLSQRAELRGEMFEATYLIQEDARRLVKFVRGQSKHLSFDKPFFIHRPDVDTNLRERLLALTAEERKRVGLKKSTYSMMRKALLSGRPVRLYQKVSEKIESLDSS